MGDDRSQADGSDRSGFASGSDDTWETATWEGAEMETLLAGARMPFREKLAWLEHMGRLAGKLAGSRERS